MHCSSTYKESGSHRFLSLSTKLVNNDTFNQPSVDTAEQERHEARKALADAIERRSQLKAREAQSEDREAVKAYSVALHNGLKNNINEAFEELARNLSNYARVFSRSFPSIDGEDAEDAVTATLLAIWQNLTNINPESLLAYSLVTLRRKMQRSGRKPFKLHSSVDEGEWDEALEEVADWRVEYAYKKIEDELVVENLVEVLRELLSPREADIIIGLYFLEMSPSEIAAELKFNVNQVYIMVHRALKKLRQERSIDRLKRELLYVDRFAPEV